MVGKKNQKLRFFDSLALFRPLVLRNKAMGSLKRILLSSVKQEHNWMLEWDLRYRHLAKDLHHDHNHCAIITGA